MDTIRELIIQEFMARAAVIRTTDSPQAYATDIGGKVLRARLKINPADLPCLVVWPLVEEAENSIGNSRHRMPLKIEGIAAFGAVEPSVISERILGDLIKCFTSPTWDRTRPGSPTPENYVESIVYQGGGTNEYPDETSATVGAAATFIVTYYTAIGDPYTQ